MKKLFFFFIPTIIVLAILSKFVYNTLIQKADFAYHNNLSKSIQLYSDDFNDTGFLPSEVTEDSINVAPSLKWNNLPKGTKSLCIIALDYDAPSPNFRLMTIEHWVLFNIDPKINSIYKGFKKSDTTSLNISFGKNISGGEDYVGPNPPFGTHTYYFRIYALNIPKVELNSPGKDELMDKIKGNIIAYGELTGKYKKK